VTLQINSSDRSQVTEQYLLLLDDPDNHLDLDKKQLLTSNLAHLSGSFILVSHDEKFIKQGQITGTFILS